MFRRRDDALADCEANPTATPDPCDMDNLGRCPMNITTSTTIGRVMRASERVTAGLTEWWRIEFATPSSGVASPVFRSNPGFVGG